MTTIKGARKKLGLTQKQMSEFMGMAQPSLARIETGSRKETKGHIAHLIALELIFKHGLLDNLATKLKEYNARNNPPTNELAASFERGKMFG